MRKEKGDWEQRSARARLGTTVSQGFPGYVTNPFSHMTKSQVKCISLIK
jgi:hypothetical protein